MAESSSRTPTPETNQVEEGPPKKVPRLELVRTELVAYSSSESETGDSAPFDPDQPGTSGLPPPVTRESESESESDGPLTFSVPNTRYIDYDEAKWYDWVFFDDTKRDPHYQDSDAASESGSSKRSRSKSPPRKAPRAPSREAGPPAGPSPVEAGPVEPETYSETDTESSESDDGSPPSKRRAVPCAPPEEAEPRPVTDWVPPSGWAIKCGFLWCPKFGRGCVRRALNMHVRGCKECPLNVNRKALADIQTWAAPDADRSLDCPCGATITRTAQYGLRKVVNRHVKKCAVPPGQRPQRGDGLNPRDGLEGSVNVKTDVTVDRLRPGSAQGRPGSRQLRV